MSEKLQELVSDMIDAWDDVPNDEKQGMTPWLDRLGEKCEAIKQLVDDPDSHVPTLNATKPEGEL